MARIFLVGVPVAAPIVLAVAMIGGPAQAQDLGMSASFNGPNPNPVPAGTTTSLSAQFAVPSDVGAVTVSVELQGAGSDGAMRVDPAATSAALANCVETGAAVTCEWDGESVDSPQTLTVFIDVAATAAPNTNWTLAAFVDSATTDPTMLTNTQVFVAAPVGTTSLSGTVITNGGAAVEAACVFVLSSPPSVFQAITDTAGEWTVTGLPDDYEFAVAAVPPFDGAFGPCANDGPPPMPGPGELQPVFHPDIWIDLSDPDLVGGAGDPYAYAIARGATNFSVATTGIALCLTAAAGDVVPRPACIQPVPTTTTTTTTTTSTTTTTTVVANTTTSVSESEGNAPTTTLRTIALLPATGSADAPLRLLAATLVMLGTVAVVGSRHRKHLGPPSGHLDLVREHLDGATGE